MSEKTLTRPFFLFGIAFPHVFKSKSHTPKQNLNLKKPQAHLDGQYLMHTLHTQASLHCDTRHKREQPEKRRKMCF